MQLQLRRDSSSEKATLGRLFVDGEFLCYTLEDVVRAEKVAGETAIPAGTYRVIVTHSPHFGRDLPLLVDVPGYEGVRIHPGNTDADTEGCILVGTTIMGPDDIANSRAAFALLFSKIQAALQDGSDCWIDVLQA